MSIETVLFWSAAVISVGGAFTMIWKLVKPLIQRIKSLSNSLDLFTRDWFGEPATSGRDAVPGVMARLNKIDGELKHNGGSTMKDAVKRIEQKVDRIDERIEKGDKRFIEGETRFQQLEQRLDNLEKSTSDE